MSTDSSLTPGEEGQANPSDSGAGVQPNSDSPVTLEQVLESIKELKTRYDEIPELIRRETQSTKDRRIAKVTEQVDGLKQVLQDLGIPLEEATRALLLQDLVNEQANPNPPAQNSKPATPPDPWQVSIDTLLSTFGVPATDPEVMRAMQNGEGMERYNAIVNVVNKRATTPAAKPSQRITDAPAGSSPKPDVMAAFQKELAAIPRGNVSAIIALKEKYRKEYGLNVY